MKKIGFFLLLSMSFVVGSGFTFAGYTPDSATTTQLSTIKNTLSSVSPSDLWNYYQQFSQLRGAARGYDEKLDYLLSNLSDYSYSQFSSQKSLAKQLAKSDKQDFISAHQGKLVLDKDIPAGCLGWYNLLDNLSFANNFPTALTIAVRHRETTCGYVLPKNGDGPFQIISKEYGSGAITEEVFVQTVQDFLDFARNKIQRYNKANQKSGHQISLNYTGASLIDLLRFSALYNGLSGSSVYGEILPMSPKYFREGYTNEVWTGDAAKDGLFATYLKVTNWELTH